ncbi:hypothetical protein EYF80_030580 [Liparis tanakae]|uniref:Secreted protein n=1 Tax=Liparis tanakae TaxID=230148 RepID=A0A4Z2H005_9TELE|nr:hypothetical protein EYF80_030580 [Liparis tanakae]
MASSSVFTLMSLWAIWLSCRGPHLDLSRADRLPGRDNGEPRRVVLVGVASGRGKGRYQSFAPTSSHYRSLGKGGEVHPEVHQLLLGGRLLHAGFLELLMGALSLKSFSEAWMTLVLSQARMLAPRKKPTSQ